MKPNIDDLIDMLDDLKSLKDDSYAIFLQFKLLDDWEDELKVRAFQTSAKAIRVLDYVIDVIERMNKEEDGLL